jgi:hypothetical protein
MSNLGWEGSTCYMTDLLGETLERALSHGGPGQAKHLDVLHCMVDQARKRIGMCSVAGWAGSNGVCPVVP